MNLTQYIAAISLLLITGLSDPVAAGSVAEDLEQAMKADVLEQLDSNVKALFKEGVYIRQRFASGQDTETTRIGLKRSDTGYQSATDTNLLYRTGFNF